MKALKNPFIYLLPYTVYVVAFYSMGQTGLQSWLTLIFVFGLVPLLELFVHTNADNLTKVEEELVKQNKWYDYMLYLVLPFQLFAMYWFMHQIDMPQLSFGDKVGKIVSMGILCGVFGINVGHELGHRNNFWEQILAKGLLLSSLYMHFFIEHNKGHHKNVATPLDPATAPINEPIYSFYLRSIWHSYLSAWHIANTEMVKKGRPIFSIANPMLQMQLIQLFFIVLLAATCGFLAAAYYVAASAIGILLLETVNYIEHYGLSRKQLPSGHYEKVQPAHSWNSDHVLGRLLLFELSRHSDHHYMASRKYQILRSHESALQLPTGYPGSMLLSLIPPLWFGVMNKRIKST